MTDDVEYGSAIDLLTTKVQEMEYQRATKTYSIRVDGELRRVFGNSSHSHSDFTGQPIPHDEQFKSYVDRGHHVPDNILELDPMEEAFFVLGLETLMEDTTLFMTPPATPPATPTETPSEIEIEEGEQ
jgi:hypothetical protein